MQQSPPHNIVCPLCHQGLQLLTTELRCSGCDARYPQLQQGTLNLHPPRIKEYHFTKTTAPPSIPDTEFFQPIQAAANPEVDFSTMGPVHHIFTELLSHIPKAQMSGATALDLGCGAAQNRQICEHAGYNYLGLDYRDPRADIQADAHALPLADNSIDFAISMAVLEHLHDPELALRELQRVLKPGALFVGSVAFLQPFHDNSYCHLSHLGIYQLLFRAGFTVKAVAPCNSYSLLQASSHQLFRTLGKKWSRRVVAPLFALHKWWWKYHPISPGNPRLNEIIRTQKFSGVQHFIAQKSNNFFTKAPCDFKESSL